MAKLKLEGIIESRTCELVDRLVVGGALDCDIRIVQKGIAPHHCAVFAEKGSYWVEHLASDGYTLCNNRVVTRSVLHNGDTIVLGETRLTFLDPDIESEPDLFGRLPETSVGKVQLPVPAQIDVTDNMARAAKGMITTCGICGRAVNRRQSKCPVCGARLSRERKRKKRTLPRGHWSYMEKDFREVPVTFERLVRCVDEGQLTRNSSVRGPTTNYEWLPAGEVVDLARYLGACQDCGAEVESWQRFCHVCGVKLAASGD